MGNKHETRELRVPRGKILHERRMQERQLIFEKNLLQAQEHAVLEHPPPCSSSGHAMISERLLRPPLSEQVLLTEWGCYPHSLELTFPTTCWEDAEASKASTSLNSRGIFHRDLVHTPQDVHGE